jgi:L-ribulose-5-phosphate 4-epimerase
MLKSLREEVFEANLELVRQGLVIYNFGNASGISRQEGLVVIKPSGVSYKNLKPADLVVTDLEGNCLEGDFRPSSDLPTHLVLYRTFPSIGGIVHTHSSYATAWAQAKRKIPCLGTTHADYFHGPIPVTEPMKPSEIEKDYEENTGQVIVRCFAGLDPEQISAVLVSSHGPFCWGSTAYDAAHIAVIVEELARIAFFSLSLNPDVSQIAPNLLDRHFFRKHGPGAYYGQK